MRRFKSIRWLRLILIAAVILVAIPMITGQIRIRAASPATYTVIAGGGDVICLIL